MRHMSFALTTKQYQEGTKNVTRRLGWAYLKPGEHFMGVDRVMGFKKGEHPIKYHPARVISNVSEPLDDIVRRPVRESGIPEVELEGFPELSPADFVRMLCSKTGIKHYTPVNRIEFEHLDLDPVAAARAAEMYRMFHGDQQ